MCFLHILPQVVVKVPMEKGGSWRWASVPSTKKGIKELPPLYPSSPNHEARSFWSACVWHPPPSPLLPVVGPHAQKALQAELCGWMGAKRPAEARDCGRRIAGRDPPRGHRERLAQETEESTVDKLACRPLLFTAGTCSHPQFLAALRFWSCICSENVIEKTK